MRATHLGRLRHIHLMTLTSKTTLLHLDRQDWGSKLIADIQPFHTHDSAAVSVSLPLDLSSTWGLKTGWMPTLFCTSLWSNNLTPGLPIRFTLALGIVRPTQYSILAPSLSLYLTVVLPPQNARWVEQQGSMFSELRIWESYIQSFEAELTSS